MWGVVFTACVVSPSFFPFQYSQAWLWCAWLVLSFFSKIISWQHAINCPVWQFRGAGRLRCRATHSRARRCCFGLWSQLKGRPDGEGGHVVNTDMCTHTHSHTHTPKYTHVGTHTSAHTYTHTCNHIHIRMRTQANVQICTTICIHLHTRARTHAHTHTHLCMHVFHLSKILPMLRGMTRKVCLVTFGGPDGLTQGIARLYP